LGPGSALQRYTLQCVRDTIVSGIARRIRLAKDMDGIARPQLTASEHRIGVQREIGDREGADAVKYPGCETFHSPGFRSATREKPAQAGLKPRSDLPSGLPH